MATADSMKQTAGTTAEWATYDKVLPKGVIGVEYTDEGDTKIKIGSFTGTKKFSELEYVEGKTIPTYTHTIDTFVNDPSGINSYDNGDEDPIFVSLSLATISTPVPLSISMSRGLPGKYDISAYSPAGVLYTGTDISFNVMRMVEVV